MTTPHRDKLARIAYWANILSWIVVVLQIAYSLWAIGVEIQTGAFGFRTMPISFFPFLMSIVGGLTSFLILQAISVGATVLLSSESQ